MFSESVLAGLPFPSRHSFRVILFLESFQLLSKFTRHRLYLSSLQLVLCRVAAVKRLPVHQP